MLSPNKSQAFRRGESLMARFTQESGVGVDDVIGNSSVLIGWVNALGRSIEKRETYNQYRQWICFYLKHSGLGELAQIVRGIKHGAPVADLPARLVEARREKTKNAGAIKSQKGFAASNLVASDIERLIREMQVEKIDSVGRRKRKYKNGLLLYIIFRMSCQTGLRPIEWFDARVTHEISDDSGAFYKTVLVVKNADKGMQSGGSVYRLLSLDDFTDEDMKYLEALLLSIGGLGEDEYREVLKRCTDLMRKICQTVFGEAGLIGLYAARHIYASEFRRHHGFKKIELAAALGHTDIQNQRFYGDYEDDGARQTDWALARPVRSNVLEVESYVEGRSYVKKMRFKEFLKSRAAQSNQSPAFDMGS